MTVPLPTGVLYVVATPIGNLEDLTFRALRILREVDLIAAEDTRRTAKLLAHYEIHKPAISLREHNETRETPRLLERLTEGDHIALVSDAGTPAIADPGARLVRAAHEHGIKVVPIPGPSAITAALSVAGLHESEFAFMGFPPPGGSERRRWFERLAQETRAVVFFEAPHRIHRTVAETLQCCGSRPIYSFREISKINEELAVSPITDVTRIRDRGEFVLVLASQSSQPSLPSEPVDNLVGRLTECADFTTDEIVRIVSSVNRVSERSAAKLLKKHEILVKRHQP